MEDAMPLPLWKIREQKGLSVKQLAARSGVPAISIAEYESGRAIRSADLPRLAKVLFVEEWEIELQSEPRPKSSPDEGRKRPTATTRPDTGQEDRPASPRKPAPARTSQIEHLLNLVGRHFDKDRDALELEVGKPLEQLTRREASDVLKKYQTLLTEASASDSTGRTPQRKRAYLPEGVDQFEQEYLTAQQDAGAILHFTLFDGTKTAGRVIGFSPYSITIDEQGTGNELTLQKLAIAYYSVPPQQPSDGGVER
jgi:transcriptional regulator with XRE-family HTH domain